MELFYDEQTRLLENYRRVDRPAHPELGLETRLVISLGAHGLLTVGLVTDDTIDDSFQNLISVLAQITQMAFDRFDTEEAVRFRSAAMESVMDGIGITDETGSFHYVNPAFADIYGYSDPEELIGTSWKTLYPDDEVRRLEEEILPVVADQGHWRGEVIGKRTDGSQFFQEHSLASFDDQLVCIVRDVTQRKVREQRLEALNEVAHELISAETHDEVIRIGIEAIKDVFDFEIACIRTFDQSANQLEPAALTDEARELFETRTAYDLEATLAGRAFRTEETVVNVISDDSLSASTSAFDRSSIHVPIGSYGVLSLLVRGSEEVTDSDISLIEILAVGIRVALVQADQIRLLSTQERKLSQQYSQLKTLNQINDVNNEIITSLITTTTREELDRTICERLASSDLYRSAWIGTIESVTDRIETTVGVGVADSYFDGVSETPLSEIADGIVEQAIETKEIQVIHRYQTAVSGTSRAEFDGDVEAIAAVPLTYDDRTIGVLVINSVHEDVFSENAIDAFQVLGKIVGFAKNALKSKELLLSESVIELEFILSDPSVFHVRITDELDCCSEFERAILIENGRLLTYHTISGTDPEPLLERAEEVPAIESARVVSNRTGSFVLQTVTSNSIVQLASKLGTTVRTMTAAEGEGTVVIEAPPSADVRKIVTEFEREYEPLELAAKREREHSQLTKDKFRESVVNQLTEKQYTALESAYFAGYYDWPREITAEELAESMEIAPATLHQHLRKGNHRLLSTFFDNL
ncbi:bacterio-opsin activator domain-containing protein [Natronococcus pandeyae]|nr:bacterio-opsin activator domain-containing protein [Natronococcus pandeyae]